MNYRSITDLNNCIVANQHKLPRDIDLVVGIPRSGLLAANLLALHRNLPLADLEGYLKGRTLKGGMREKSSQAVHSMRAVVIDDSVLTGSALDAAKARIHAAGLEKNVLYGCIYAAPRSVDKVDFYFDTCASPRVFEWNILHHGYIANSCLDIDGVLCCDPTETENDDGVSYDQFLNQAAPLWIPTVQVGWLVTSRLEKYRSQTEKWLARNGVKYGELIMLNMKTAAERQAARCHGRFKGEVYLSKSSELFIESDPGQAAEIAEISSKPVFCITDRQMHFPSTKAVARNIVRRLPTGLPKLSWRILNAIRRRML